MSTNVDYFFIFILIPGAGEFPPNISNLLRTSMARQLSRQARVLAEGRPILPVGVTA